jgi:hypothetical protein
MEFVMKTTRVRKKVLEEIKLIPEEKLPEILNFIHHVRQDVQLSNIKSNRKESFAGCWRDMPDEVYNEFVSEITQRRQAAFSRRRNGESGIG